MTKVVLKISLLYFFFLMTGINQKLIAIDTDSIQSSLSSEKILYLKTLWSESNNAAGLWYFNVQKRLGKAELNFHLEEGEYHRLQGAEKQNKYGFYTDGYAALKNWKFYGDFNYFGQKDLGAQWVDVLDPFDDNPYILGDASKTRYTKEYFDMNAKGAWNINSRFNMGFEVNYKTGVGARRKDPRPENTSTSFDIKPGIIYTFKHVNIGANFHFQTAKEDITFENITDSIYSYFHFKGLGAFTSSQEEDERSQESTLMGGGLQFAFNGDKFRNLTEVNFYQKENDIKRGKTYPLQVVLFEKFQTDISSVFIINPSQLTANKLQLYFNDKHIYGHEPVVDPQLIQQSYQWKTVGKYTLYWLQENNFGLNYSYYKLHDNNHINWGASFNSSITKSQSKYYFIPEKNNQELNYFTLNTTLEKEFITQPADIVLSFSSGIRKGFNSSLELVADESLLETVNSELVQHDFDYFNERLIQFGGKIQFGKNINIYHTSTQLFLTAEYNRQTSQMHSNSNRDNFTIQLGINF
uniref:DUF6850 family outer membrane beta-barrel protein n=1 Tax=uncultured Draconibacterium sp. TaxID=1573823 RepID=UPI003217558C